MKESKQLAKIFKALGEENRLKILSNILKGECDYQAGGCCEQDTCCIKEYSKSLKISFATISHHIKELTNSGLITTKKEGRRVCCQLNKRKLIKAQDFLTKLLN